MKNGVEVFNKLKEVDAAIFSNELNALYLTDYECSNCFVILSANKCWFLTDSRYSEEAAIKLSPDYEVVEINVQNQFDAITNILKSFGASKIGLEEETLSYSQYKATTSRLAGFSFFNIEPSFYEICAVKDEKEIENTIKACKINDLAFNDVLKYIKAGVSERDVKCEMEYRLKKFGADGLAFDTIVAAGKNTSKPHAHAGDYKLASGDPITIDFGSVVGGSSSDITRSFFLGEPKRELIKLYETVLTANKLGIEAVRDGAKASDVDAACRNYFKSEGVDKYFLHGTGHGVGVRIHEAPTLNPRSEETLKSNMLVTVEPGIYLPDEYGIRIEDLLLVADDGCKQLTITNKKIMII